LSSKFLLLKNAAYSRHIQRFIVSGVANFCYLCFGVRAEILQNGRFAIGMGFA
jgi:hypothetical protein